jgi:RimJ/RimL family protein N-acetyltransferase
MNEGLTSAFVVEPLAWPADADTVVAFLTEHEWPFHGVPRLSPEAAAAVRVAADDMTSFWIRENGRIVGLIRLFDLDDLDNGSPLFDLRIATKHRSQGIGRFAVDWLTTHLFTTYPELHRIEATTRSDNAAMQAVFARCGYRQEGRMLEAWKNADGSRSDTLTYALLRREFTARTFG